MKNCIICGKKMQPHKLPKLIKCSSCNYVCADYSDEEINAEELYDTQFWKGREYTDYVADADILKKNFGKRIKELLRFIDCPSQKNIFEIGCAYGFFLEEAIHYFKFAGGIDVSEPAITYAKNSLKNKNNIDVYMGDYLEHTLDKIPDVICMWDTIEHLSNPEEFLEKAYTDLNDKGIIGITTGDIGSLNARLRGKKWRQYKPPIHLQYFTKKSLTRLLEKKGFDILSVSYIWNEMSLNNVLYIILCIRSNHKKLYNLLVALGIKKIQIYINLRDYMFVIAQKRS